MNAGAIQFCALQKVELNSFQKVVLEKLMTPFADCVATIVHCLNCSGCSAQKSIVANYAIQAILT